MSFLPAMHREIANRPPQDPVRVTLEYMLRHAVGRVNAIPLGTIVSSLGALGDSRWRAWPTLQGIAHAQCADEAILLRQRRQRRQRIQMEVHLVGVRQPPAPVLVLRWRELGERNAALDQVRDLLGHASILTTERYDNQRLEALQTAVERLEGGKTFDPKIDASDRVSTIFQDPLQQSFARREDPAKESATSH